MIYYYNNNQNNNQKNQNGNGLGSISWILIAVTFALGLWPISLILLYFKLFATGSDRTQQQVPTLKNQEAHRTSERVAQEQKEHKEQTAEKAKETVRSIFRTPQDEKKNYVMLMALGFALALLALFGIFVSSGSMGFSGVMFVLSCIIGAAATAGSGINMKKAMSRYASYLAVMGSNKAVEIAGLAKKTGIKEERVEKDLQKMIDKGYFAKGAYLNKELGYFFASTEADEELSQAIKAARKKTAEAAKAEAAKQSANVYEQFIMQIKDVNDRIPGEEMTAKINTLEDITKEIFAIVQKEPEKRPKIDRFMSYFLPTTLKLLESYATLDKSNAEGDNITQSKQSIETAMNSIVDGFRHQLAELYKTDTLNIETEIDVLTQMMDRETAGVEKDFKVATSSGGGTAK